MEVGVEEADAPINSVQSQNTLMLVQLLLSACFSLSVYILSVVQFFFFTLFRVLHDTVPGLRHPLSGKAVLVTGCDTGFGRAIATALDKMGCLVFANCLTEEGAHQLRQSSSIRMVCLVFDISSPDQVAKAFDKVQTSLEQWNVNGLWALINNAGISSEALVEATDLATYRKVMNVNLFGTIDMCKTFIPLLRHSNEKSPRVINIASILGTLALPTFSAYSASKFALAGFSDCLRRELSASNIKVCIVQPGLCATMLPRTARAKLEKDIPNLTEYVLESYGVEFFQNQINLTSLYEHIAQNPDYVVKDVVRLTASKYPPHRLTTGMDSMCAWMPLSMLPSVASDFWITLGLKFKNH